MSELTKEGALYELFARGNKDVYFQADSFSSVSPFRNNYKRVPAYIHERRQIPSINNIDFGKIVEFEFEVAGDLYTHPTLLIDLPTWLSTEYAVLNNNSLIQDLSGNSYGYTKGIGYFLFSKIQIYQDQILIQEFSGDALYATKLSRNSINLGFLENNLVGIHDGSDLSIQRNATLKQIRLELPLLGCQSLTDGGFPSYGVRSQIFRLRLTLRKLEDLVECSNSTITKPNLYPWNRSDFVHTSQSGTTTQFSTLDRYQMSMLNIYLETRHIYVDPDTQKALVETPNEVVFSRLYENIFYFNDKDYAPLINNAVASVLKRIDAVHPSSRIVFFLRQKSDIDINKLWKINSNTINQEYYNNISLLIASRDRETLFPPFVWNLIAQHAKEERYSGEGLGIMNWDLGEQRGRRAPFTHQPEGSVNFSTADKPNIYVDLQNISGSNRNTEMLLIVDTWSIYEIENRRGRLKYSN
jgi:hypothetical protein